MSHFLHETGIIVLYISLNMRFLNMRFFGLEKNNLIDMVLLSINSICFGGEWGKYFLNTVFWPVVGGYALVFCNPCPIGAGDCHVLTKHHSQGAMK